MINDGYWKLELEKELKVFKKNKKHFYEDTFSYMHRINRSLLYSAVIIRRMFEDDKEAEPYFKTYNHDIDMLALLNYKVKVNTYTNIVDRPIISHKIIPEFYDFNELQISELKLNEICNQIIHSFSWSPVLSSDRTKIVGIILSSDRYKDTNLYQLSIEEWIKAIEFCLKKSTVK